MLYRPQWTIDIETDPLTIEGLIAWLEMMPARGTYRYNNCAGDCLYGQYMAAHGIRWDESGAIGDAGPDRSNFCYLVYGFVASEKPWTFGAALERARVYAEGRS